MEVEVEVGGRRGKKTIESRRRMGIKRRKWRRGNWRREEEKENEEGNLNMKGRGEEKS